MKISRHRHSRRFFGIISGFVVVACVGVGVVALAETHPQWFSGLHTQAAVSEARSGTSASKASTTSALPSSVISGMGLGASTLNDPTEVPATTPGVGLDLTSSTSLPGEEIPLRFFNLGLRQWFGIAADTPFSASQAPVQFTLSLHTIAGSHQIRGSNNLCLEVVGGALSTTVVMAGCRDTAEQEFLSLGQVGGGIVVQSIFTGTALTALFAGQSLRLAPVSGAPSQRWLLLPAN